MMRGPPGIVAFCIAVVFESPVARSDPSPLSHPVVDGSSRAWPCERAAWSMLNYCAANSVRCAIPGGSLPPSARSSLAPDMLPFFFLSFFLLPPRLWGGVKRRSQAEKNADVASNPRGHSKLKKKPKSFPISCFVFVIRTHVPVVEFQAADRGAYICQSQSMNVHMAEASFGKLSSMHFYAWKKGLKTGMYYLRTRPKADAIQFTVDQSSLKVSREESATGNAAAAAAAAANAAAAGAVAPAAPTPGLEVEEEPECLSCGA